MREFATQITFGKLLVVAILGAVYIGATADLPVPKKRKPQRDRAVSMRAAPIQRRSLPAPPVAFAPDAHAVAVPGAAGAGADVTPLAVWQGSLPQGHAAGEGPAGTVVSDLRTWRETWIRLRGEEPPPSIDFSRDVVVLGMLPGANVAALKVWRDAAGRTRVTVFACNTPATRGGYILARFNKKSFAISTVRKAASRDSKG